MYCICCNNQVKPIYYSDTENQSEESHIWDVVIVKDDEGKEIRQEKVSNRMWGDGIVQILSAGYGSNHDTEQFILAICDSCVTKKKEEGTLLYFGNYMSPKSKWVNEEIEKSKKIYKRRRNLDDLV
jgi:hypothetical protein